MLTFFFLECRVNDDDPIKLQKKEFEASLETQANYCD